MTDSIWIIARYTFTEALRNRLFVLMAVGLVCLFGIAEFTGELAITETRGVQAVITASVIRWFTVISFALFVISSIVREFNDKGFELILSLPVSRATYYFGKFSGFLALAVTVSLASGLLLVLYADPLTLLIWLISLLCEITLIIAMSMLCLFTFSNITVSFVTVILFYLLSRSMATILLISQSPILDTQTPAQQFIDALLNAIAYLLPDLDKFTSSEWLVYGFNGQQLWLVVLQTLVYLILLISAGLFDLYRKEL